MSTHMILRYIERSFIWHVVARYVYAAPMAWLGIGLALLVIWSLFRGRRTYRRRPSRKARANDN